MDSASEDPWPYLRNFDRRGGGGGGGQIYTTWSLGQGNERERVCEGIREAQKLNLLLFCEVHVKLKRSPSETKYT